MTAIVDLSVPAEDFELGQLVLGHPGMRVELERIVPLKEGVLPFFWVSGGTPDSVEETLLSSPDVESVERLTELEDETLYQVWWSPNIDGFVESLVTTGGTVLEGGGTDTEWTFRLRFPDHESLSTFGDACEQKEIQLNIRSVYNPHPPEVESSLTPAQRQTLRIAFDKGYFEVPRRVTLPELATEFDVSKQAVSQRLRRGLNNLLSDTEL